MSACLAVDGIAGPRTAAAIRAFQRSRGLVADGVVGLRTLPTVAETPGLGGVEASGFIGIAGPAGMPRLAVARLEAAVAWAAGETDLPARFAAQGVLAQR